MATGLSKGDFVFEWTVKYRFLAEEAGFEPAVGLILRTLSRRVT